MVIFQIPLQFRNNDHVPRLIKVRSDQSSYFSIVAPDDVSKKVAPGMSTTFMVKFRPDAVKDYTHELICTSERERFLVPIKCIGSRGVLDFPDQMDMSTCAVKMSRPKTILVRNVGQSTARFSMATSSEAFSVEPNHGELEVGDAMQVTVDFQPSILGDIEGELCVSYDTGEDVYTALHGIGIQLDVMLNQSELNIAPTYIGKPIYRLHLANFRFRNGQL